MTHYHQSTITLLHRAGGRDFLYARVACERWVEGKSSYTKDIGKVTCKECRAIAWLEQQQEKENE